MSGSSMLKWLELTKASQKGRCEFLSNFLQQQGIENQWQHIQVTKENFVESLKTAMKDYDQILLDTDFESEIRENLVDLSTKHYFSPTSDCLLKDKNLWLPRSFMEDSFIEVLNKQTMTFDIQANALIVGCDALARIAIHSFLKIGYTRFSICDKDKNKVETFFSNFLRHNFNVKFKFISQDDLAYLPGTSSLLVNTLSADASSDLMHDLFYFNYLNKNSVVLDLNLLPLESSLILQARDLGFRYIEGYKFYALRDFHWLQAISQQKFKWEGFEEAWLKGIKTAST